jgi:hypothetical protein
MSILWAGTILTIIGIWRFCIFCELELRAEG